MVEVVVGEEEVVYVCGPESCFDELVGCGGAAVEHELLVADLRAKAEPKRVGVGVGVPAPRTWMVVGLVVMVCVLCGLDGERVWSDN